MSVGEADIESLPKSSIKAPLSPCKQMELVSTLIYEHQQAQLRWDVTTVRTPTQQEHRDSCNAS